MKKYFVLSFALTIVLLLTTCKPKETTTTFYVPVDYLNAWYNAFNQGDLWVFRDSTTGRVDTFVVTDKSKIISDKKTESHFTTYSEIAQTSVKGLRTNTLIGTIVIKGNYQFTLGWNGLEVFLTKTDFANIANGELEKPLLYAMEDNTMIKKTNVIVNGVEFKDAFDVKLNDNPNFVIDPVSHVFFSSPKGVLKMTYRSGGYSERIN